MFKIQKNSYDPNDLAYWDYERSYDRTLVIIQVTGFQIVGISLKCCLTVEAAFTKFRNKKAGSLLRR